MFKEINTITDIANYLSLSKANISILTTKLEENGYIERDKNSTEDSRVSLILVTEKGEKAFLDVRNRVFSSLQKLRTKYEEANIDIDNVFNNLKRVTNIDQSTHDIEDILLIVSIKINNIFEEIYQSIIKLYKFDLSVAEFKIIKKLALLSGYDFESMDNESRDTLFKAAESKMANFEILTEEMALSYSTLSLQVKGLVEKGFITKCKSFDDGRITFLKLTDKGNEVYEVFKKQKYELVKSRLSHKTESEIVDFVTVFENLFKIMEISHKNTELNK